MKQTPLLVHIAPGVSVARRSILKSSWFRATRTCAHSHNSTIARCHALVHNCFLALPVNECTEPVVQHSSRLGWALDAFFVPPTRLQPIAYQSHTNRTVSTMPCLPFDTVSMNRIPIARDGSSLMVTLLADTLVRPDDCPVHWTKAYS
jgi:hypothetical protein